MINHQHPYYNIQTNTNKFWCQHTNAVGLNIICILFVFGWIVQVFGQIVRLTNVHTALETMHSVHAYRVVYIYLPAYKSHCFHLWLYLSLTHNKSLCVHYSVIANTMRLQSICNEWYHRHRCWFMPLWCVCCVSRVWKVFLTSQAKPCLCLATLNGLHTWL